MNNINGIRFNSRGAGKIHQRSARLEQTRLLCFNSRGAGKIHPNVIAATNEMLKVSIPAARVRYIVRKCPRSTRGQLFQFPRRG